jgi:hypothetical protein
VTVVFMVADGAVTKPPMTCRRVVVVVVVVVVLLVVHAAVNLKLSVRYSRGKIAGSFTCLFCATVAFSMCNSA